MPFDRNRFKQLREAKEFSQEKLAEISQVNQSVIARAEQGKSAPRADALDRLAVALDCTIDYLHGRSFEGDDVGVAAARMAFDVFARAANITDEQRVRCKRALAHPDAPKTARAWHAFAEMIDMALGPVPFGATNLTVVKPRVRSAKH